MKILCTVGPNINNNQILEKLIHNGMNVVRFNFSHIDYELSKTLINYIKNNHKDISIMQDLQGNKIRISNLFKKEIKVLPKDKVYFCSEEIYKKYNKGYQKGYILVPLTFEGDFSLLSSADSILMKDATMKFKILDREKEIIKTSVVRGGILRAEKGVNAPGMDRRNMGLTIKDKNDIMWGIENGVDIICLSYVCYKENIMELKNYIKGLRKQKDFKMPKIWAKIESKEGIENFKEILRESNGIMLGRGDLVAEVDILELPKIQKDLLSIMKKSKKDFIIGTYVLDSMRRNAIPTASEINDIYNFMQNKVDGFMLAGEVSIGQNPVLVVKTLKDVIDRYSY